MSVGINVQVTGLDEVEARLALIVRQVSRRDPSLAEVVGALVENQTRRRLQDEKRSPSGVPWAPWSPAYAATRHGNHSLLIDTGALQDSIQYLVDGDDIEVGSNLVYAHRQQEGDNFDSGSLGDLVGGIPARPFLGVSAENATEIESAVAEYMDGLLGGRK